MKATTSVTKMCNLSKKQQKYNHPLGLWWLSQRRSGDSSTQWEGPWTWAACRNPSTTQWEQRPEGKHMQDSGFMKTETNEGWRICPIFTLSKMQMWIKIHD